MQRGSLLSAVWCGRKKGSRPFLQVEDLLRRLRGVLPDAPLIGGVTQPAAWGEGRSLRGAVFLNSATHDEGAVGCLMRGPLRMDQLCWQVPHHA